MRSLVQFVAGLLGAAIGVALVVGITAAYGLYLEHKYPDEVGASAPAGFLGMAATPIVGFLGIRYGTRLGGSLYDRKTHPHGS